jgi:hypothetical protein
MEERMSKKKSYMNRSNILSEGFFSKILKKIKTGKGKSDPRQDAEYKKKLAKLDKDFADSVAYLKKNHPDSPLLKQFKKNGLI